MASRVDVTPAERQKVIEILGMEGKVLYGPPPEPANVRPYRKSDDYEGGDWYTQEDADLLMRIMEARLDVMKEKMTSKMFKQYMERTEPGFNRSPLQQLNDLDAKARQRFQPMRLPGNSANIGGVRMRPYVAIPSINSKLQLRPVNVDIVKTKYLNRNRKRDAMNARLAASPDAKGYVIGSKVHNLVIPLLGAKHMAILGVTRPREMKLSPNAARATKGKWGPQPGFPRGLPRIQYGRYHYDKELYVVSHEGIRREEGPTDSTYGVYITPNVHTKGPNKGKLTKYGVTYNTISRVMQAAARGMPLMGGFRYEVNDNYNPAKNEGRARNTFKFDYGDNVAAVQGLLRVRVKTAQDGSSNASLFFVKPAGERTTQKRGVLKMRSTTKYQQAVARGEAIRGRDRLTSYPTTGNVSFGQESSQSPMEQG
jgi:hypothetical protein